MRSAATTASTRPTRPTGSGPGSETGAAATPRRRRVALGSIAVLLVLCAGLATFSTDLTAEDTYRTEVESIEGQDLVNKSFASGTTRRTDVVVQDKGDVRAVRAAAAKGGRV